MCVCQLDIPCSAIMILVITVIVLLSTSGGLALSDDGPTLSQHFDTAARNHGRGLKAPALPRSAAWPVLRLTDSALAGGSFDALMLHEISRRLAAPEHTRFPFVACGPQATAQTARDDLFAITGNAHHDVSCTYQHLIQ